MTKHHVQADLWNATGVSVVTFYDGNGNVHVLRDYPTPRSGTLRVEWVKKWHHQRYHLYQASWPAGVGIK